MLQDATLILHYDTTGGKPQMTTNIFLSKEIEKLQKKCEVNKKEVLRLYELITYLTATKEISLQDALRQTRSLLNINTN